MYCKRFRSNLILRGLIRQRFIRLRWKCLRDYCSGLVLFVGCSIAITSFVLVFWSSCRIDCPTGISSYDCCGNTSTSSTPDLNVCSLNTPFVRRLFFSFCLLAGGCAVSASLCTSFLISGRATYFFISFMISPSLESDSSSGFCPLVDVNFTPFFSCFFMKGSDWGVSRDLPLFRCRTWCIKGNDGELEIVSIEGLGERWAAGTYASCSSANLFPW